MTVRIINQDCRDGMAAMDACSVDYAGTEDAAAAAAEIRSKQTDRNFEGWGMQAQNLTAEAYLTGPAGAGRWPANLIHDGSEEVLEAFPVVTSGKPAGVKAGNNNNVYGQFAGGIPVTGFGDTGSAARFYYCAKADRNDRNEGLEGLVTDDGRKVPADNAYQRGKTVRKNHHPTVKPTDLMRYLCRLVTPKGGTVLDPFGGAGTTGLVADRHGRDAVLIELNPEYADMARKRITADGPLFAEII